MDKDEEQGQESKQQNNPNVIDSINNLRNLRKNIRGDAQGEKIQDKVANKAKGRLEQAGKKAVGKAGKRLAKQVGKKAVVAAGQALVETAPVWGIPALIILIIIIVVVIIFGGASQDTAGTVDPTCEGISTSNNSATPTSPVTLIANNCENIQTPLIYKWTVSDTAGTLSNPTSETTTYTPSSSTIKNVTVTLTICNATNSLNCSTASAIINGTTLSSCTLDYNQYPAQCLKQVYNVVVNNESNKSHLITIYTIFASTNSETYRSLLTRGGSVLYIDVPYCTSNCISVTSTNNIKLNGFFSLGLSYNSQRYLLIHESGHVITGRNSQLSNSFSNTLLANQDGTSCYQYSSTNCTGSLRAGYFVKSYSLRYYCDGTCWTGITAHNEAFAEATANYLFASRNTGGWRCSISISDVKSQCRNTNEWIKNYVYGGVTF